MSPTTNQEPPISDPVVMLGGKSYTVVYDLRAEFKCSEWDLDPREMMKILWNFQPVINDDGSAMLDGETGKPVLKFEVKGRHLYYTINLFAACVAHNFVGEVAPTGEQWTIRLNNEPTAIPIITKALYDAMGKRLRERMQGRPQPMVTPEASSSAPN
jgi:hypothetical protein